MAIFIHLVMTMTAMSWLSSSRSQLGRLQLFSSIGENLTATNHYQRTECVGRQKRGKIIWTAGYWTENARELYVSDCSWRMRRYTLMRQSKIHRRSMDCSVSVWIQANKSIRDARRCWRCHAKCCSTIVLSQRYVQRHQALQYFYWWIAYQQISQQLFTVA